MLTCLSPIFRRFVSQAFPNRSGLFSIKTRRANGEQQAQLIEIQRWLESHPAHLETPQQACKSMICRFFCALFASFLPLSSACFRHFWRTIGEQLDVHKS
jgi:hypothetical protein